MHLLFLDPVFDDRSSVAGLPAEVVILVVATVIYLAGFVLLRRITAIEREPRSFRATDRPEATGVLTRAFAIGGATFVVVLGVLLLVR